MAQPQGGGRKSRIVIDVDRVRAEAREKRSRRFGRAGRLLSVTSLIIIGVVLVLLVGTYAWWQSFRKSPPYSLAVLADAAQHDDMQTVETFIDADQIAQGFIPQIIDSLAGAGSPLPPQARASLTSVLPQLLPRVREGVRDEVAREVKGLSRGEGSSLPFFVKALGVRQHLELFEQGVRLSRECQERLNEAERRIEVLLRGGDGSTIAVPFESEELTEDEGGADDETVF
jgi:exodeoxyribonuclease VII small subunit